MTKTKFLTLLQQQICMLDDEEQKDILDEYSQHIDMKVESGMTEAEAIEDFGPMAELAAEILSAYHVKPLSAPTESVAADIEDLRRSGHNVAGAVVSLGRKGCGRVAKLLSKLIDRLKAAFKELQEWHPLRKSSQGGTGRLAGQAGSMLKGLKNGSVSFGKFCWHACLTLLRWCWNACVLCLTAFLFFCGLCAVFCMGLCVVLAVQGYPLGGVTVACLGAFMFCVSAGALVLKLVRRRAAYPQGVEEPLRVREDSSTGGCGGMGSAAGLDGEEQGGEIKTVSRTEPIPVAGLGYTRPLY